MTADQHARAMLHRLNELTVHLYGRVLVDRLSPLKGLPAINEETEELWDYLATFRRHVTAIVEELGGEQ
jgi:hypothetical protein